MWNISIINLIFCTNVIKKAVLKEFPWLALLQNNLMSTTNFCEGVLISNRYVLTNAHCIAGTNVDIVSVRLGEYDLDQNPDCVNNGSTNICAPNSIDVPVAEKIIHEDYSSIFIGLLNDIGLIRLERTVEFTDYIKPICLPTAFLDNDNLDHFENMILAGWGVTLAGSEDSRIKSKFRVPLVSNIQCATAYNGTTEIKARHICTQEIKYQDLCQGAAGSPLMEFLEYEREDNWYLFGILSHGRDCELADQSPFVYSRVTSYVPCILSKLKP